MFCTKCGARAMDNDRFCPQCGAQLKHAVQTEAAGANQAGSSGAQPSQEGKVYYTQGYTTVIEKPGAKKKEKSRTKGFRGMGLIIALLIVVVLGMLGFIGCRGYLDGELPISCGGDETPVILDNVSGSDHTVSSTAETTTTTAATTTTTTTTTQKPTTTTTVDAKKQEAEEIRNLLISRKWKTELEGYTATVEFNADGTASITVKVLFISKTIDAKYSISDKCHAVIQAEYDGQLLGISGEISKVSNTKIVVERDKNMGTVTLTAA